jgi:hypothetical protein
MVNSTIKVSESVRDAVKKKVGYGSMRAFADSALLEKLNLMNGKPSALFRMQKVNADFDLYFKKTQNVILNLQKFINFFGEYSDKNKADMIAAIGNPNRENIKLIDEVFDSGKESADDAKPLLVEALKIMKELKDERRRALAGEYETCVETKPKQLGRQPLRKKDVGSAIEEGFKKAMMKKYGLSEEQYDLVKRFSNSEGLSFEDAFVHLVRACKQQEKG